MVAATLDAMIAEEMWNACEMGHGLVRFKVMRDRISNQFSLQPSERPAMPSTQEKDLALLQRLNEDPVLRARVESLLYQHRSQTTLTTPLN